MINGNNYYHYLNKHCKLQKNTDKKCTKKNKPLLIETNGMKISIGNIEIIREKK